MILRSLQNFWSVVGALGVIVASAVIIVASPEPVFAGSTYYVSQEGDDSNSCATAQSASPTTNHKRTINNALRCLRAGAGDALNIGDGTYNESLAVGVIPPGASASVRTTLVARNKQRAIIQPTRSRMCTSVNQSFILALARVI